MKKLLILALDGVMDSSLAVTLDTLRTAQGFFGVDAEWLLVPGLDMTSRRAIEARLARSDARTSIELLRRAARGEADRRLVFVVFRRGAA